MSNRIARIEMSKKHPLELAEYISLGFSCTGLIAAAVSQQVAYAAIPLMMSLPIGLTNRQRLDRRIREVTSQVLPATQDAHTKSIAQIEHQIGQISNRVTEVSSVNSSTESITQANQLEILNIQNQTVQLNELVINLQQIIRPQNELEQQIRNLQHQILQLAQNPLETRANIVSLLDRSIAERVDELNRNIQETNPNFYYELVVDRSGSRRVLIESLEQANDRILIICPWISDFVIREIKSHIEAALRRNVKISIGWGHLSDTQSSGYRKNNQYDKLNRDDLLRLNRQGWKYGGIPILEKIQNDYPNLLTLKVIGTHEKFLIADNNLAMLGSHNFLTSGESSAERELGLKTNDSHIIGQLITRFNQPNISEIHSLSNLN